MINEGLYGWNVRFYLAALQQLSDGSAKMDVAYEVRSPLFSCVNFHLLQLTYVIEHQATLSGFDRNLSQCSRVLAHLERIGGHQRSAWHVGRKG